MIICKGVIFLDTIMSVIICFLSVYGTFHLLYSLAQHLNKRISTEHLYFHTVIGADESTENIEEYVRKAALQNDIKSLAIINYSDDKDYKQLLDILQSEFEFVSVLTPDEYKDYILSFKK